MKKVYKDLISFFSNDDLTYDKGELISEYAGEILSKYKFESEFIDEYIVVDSDGNSMAADDFATELYDRIMTGVCNAIQSFADEQ